MPLIPTAELISGAAKSSVGIGAFNVIQVEHAEALAAGARLAGVPVIMQISENAVRYHGGLAPIGLATLAVARACDAPVAVHLDHATDVELVREAVELGFGSVMFDASTLDYSANVDATANVVRQCARHGVFVEAELGEVGGKDGVHAPGARTDPLQAKEFVAATGVGALAVAVGSSHAMTDRDAVLDLELITKLADAVPVPLVLHGSSGVPDDGLAAAVGAGMTKINIATQLNKVFTHAVRRFLTEHPDVVDPRKYLAPGRDAIATESARLLTLLRAPRY